MNIKMELETFKKKAFNKICLQYKCNIFFGKLIARITRNDFYYRYKTFKYMLKYTSCNFIITKLLWYRKYSKYACKINVQIICNQIGSGFYFEHGNIVLNSSCIIGDNVTIIGNCCIGGKSDGAPVIGNNCYIGYGAIIIGNINICDNVIIGAGAIITKNITSSGKYICNNIRLS